MFSFSEHEYNAPEFSKAGQYSFIGFSLKDIPLLDKKYQNLHDYIINKKSRGNFYFKFHGKIIKNYSGNKNRNLVIGISANNRRDLLEKLEDSNLSNLKKQKIAD